MLALIGYLVAFATGLGCAFAARFELRSGTSNVWASRVCHAYGAYLVLVLVPSMAYFYIFFGDWFLTYGLASDAVPSAVALVGFMAQVVSGLGGFWLGAQFVRTERLSWAKGSIAGACVAVLAGLWWSRDRWCWVGSYEQFHRNFGLVRLGHHGLLVWSLALLAPIALAGYGYLILRLIRVRRT